MRPQEAHALSGAGPAHGPYAQKYPRTNWLHMLLAAAGLTVFSAVAGVLIYDWYFDSVLAGLAFSLEPFSNAFHQLNGDGVTPRPSQPAD